ncbi:hypothetical protein ACFV98_35580 [Streptomyces violascens]|uniref:hypothetical protein n=1 Tax=Streptomyces violascens TaxID=67381 RepID=UPI003648E74B
MTVARLTQQDRNHNEQAIRAAMERILSGNLPPGGKADVKTLAALAGVTRTGFYPKKNRDGTTRPGPYQHLAEEFERRLQQLRAAGQIPDPRAAQIDRLKTEVGTLKQRVEARDKELAELREFKTLAISRLAAQRPEIEHPRQQLLQGRRRTHAADTREQNGSVRLLWLSPVRSSRRGIAQAGKPLRTASPRSSIEVGPDTSRLEISALVAGRAVVQNAHG